MEWSASKGPPATGAALWFPHAPELSHLLRLMERPLFSLVQAYQHLHSPSARFLQQSHIAELPSAEAFIRGALYGLQSWLNGRNRFGWSWRGQLQRMRDLLLERPSPAELVAWSRLGLPAAYSHLVTRYGIRPLPIDESPYEVVGDDEFTSPPLAPLDAPAPAPPIRMVTRAYDAPVTRMDNLRRDRVLSRMASAGRLPGV